MKITSINEALKIYNKIEDKRDELRKAYDEKETALKKALDEIESYMLQEMKNMGLNEYGVPGEGIAKIKTKRNFGASDWALVWNWVIENKCPNFLQKRLLDSEMQKFLDEHGTLPPGVSTRAKIVIDVVGR